MFSEKERQNFIDYCLEYYLNNGQDCFMYIQIDNQEEEQEPIIHALPIVLNYFLFENPNLRKLSEEERTLFFDYMYGNFDLERRNFNEMSMVFRDGKKYCTY